MAILGIDQSYSGLATVFLHNNKIDADVTAFPPSKYGSGVERLVVIQNHIGSRLHETAILGPVELICIEGYAYGSKFGRELAGELSASIRLALFDDYPYLVKVIQPTLLKKFATGSGRASKQMMIESAKKNGYVTNNDNLADAFHLARLGYKLLYNSFDNSFEKEVIDDIKGINNGTNKQGRKGSTPRGRK